MTLGQLTYLPPQVANNPFYHLIVKFSRSKMGSFEILFTIEAFLLRYAWVGLFVLFALVLPPLEEVNFISKLVRLSTIIYPLFFIWSLTRISGVELMQWVLEGHITGEVLASPVNDRELSNGFITPLWLTVRQYFLISVFSLGLYGLETNPLVVIDDQLYVEDLIRNTLFNLFLFFSTVGWIIFVYLGRLLTEIRLRNGLLKGLASLALLLGGLTLFTGYIVLFWRYSAHLTETRLLAGLGGLTLALASASLLFYRRLARNFRRYLHGQLDIDLLIYDETDPHATAWHMVDEQAREPAGTP